MNSAVLSPALDADNQPGELTFRKNSLGSGYIAFHADEATVLALAKSNLDSFFRRVVLDPVRGLVLLMVPGRAHEGISRNLDDVVTEMVDALDLASVKLGATRWRRPQDPESAGAEPDCCFYLGENAVAYLEAGERGETVADAYALRHPPDLVVEVGVTHVDRDKQAFYRDLGVPEYWHIDYTKGTGPKPKATTVSFLALQAADGPRLLSTSVVLPGMQPTDVSAAIKALSDSRHNTPRSRRAALREVVQHRLNTLARG